MNFGPPPWRKVFWSLNEDKTSWALMVEIDLKPVDKRADETFVYIIHKEDA